MKKGIFVVVIILVLLVSVFLGDINFLDIENEDEKEVVSEIDFTGWLIDDVRQYLKKEEIKIEIVYEYNNKILEDVVISQEFIKNDFGANIYNMVVSRGKVPVSLYEEYQVNEMGKVPIMMYHGIVNMKSNDTKYIGGNVDEGGYQRTVEAFREDLEFYYQKGYRMIRLIDYVNGEIDVELGKSPIILTFDDGNENNFKVIGEENGELVIDPNCAIFVLEEFKKKYPDYGVTATFFVNQSLFEQDLYNEKILKWLISHGYDIGNHTMNHVDFTEIGVEDSMKEVGGMYQILNDIISSNYVPIVALPFGSPYKLEHGNYSAIKEGNYMGINYETKAVLRVGWEAEISCFDKDFNPWFLKRIRAYDNLGRDFDIEYNFKMLDSNRYVSDGDKDTVVILEKDLEMFGNMDKLVITY